MKNFFLIILISLAFISCDKRHNVKDTTKTVKSKYSEYFNGRFSSTYYYVSSDDGSVLLVGVGNHNNTSVGKIYEQIKEGDEIEGQWESVVKIKNHDIEKKQE